MHRNDLWTARVQLCGALFQANCNWSSLEQCALGTYRTNCTRAVVGSASPQLLIYIHVHTTTQSTENPTSSHIYIYICMYMYRYTVHGREKLPSFHTHNYIHVHDTSLFTRMNHKNYKEYVYTVILTNSYSPLQECTCTCIFTRFV